MGDLQVVRAPRAQRRQRWTTGAPGGTPAAIAARTAAAGPPGAALPRRSEGEGRYGFSREMWCGQAQGISSKEAKEDHLRVRHRLRPAILPRPLNRQLEYRAEAACIGSATGVIVCNKLHHHVNENVCLRSRPPVGADGWRAQPQEPCTPSRYGERLMRSYRSFPSVGCRGVRTSHVIPENGAGFLRTLDENGRTRVVWRLTAVVSSP